METTPAHDVPLDTPVDVNQLASAGQLSRDTYPPPRYSHEEIVQNKALFDATLTEVHSQLAISYDKIPKVGGRELDLHQLYINVTALGGCERVISRKQWRDAAESFQFAPTITSVSFTLRKAYVQFLWDYEQIYFFKNTGPRVDPPVQKSKEDRDPDEAGAVSEPKRRKVVDNVLTEFPALSPLAPTALTAMAQSGTELHANMVGSRGTVTVDARFDCGFFVTVKVGRQEFKGVLYYPPPEHTTVPLPQPEKRGVGRPRKDGSNPGSSHVTDSKDKGGLQARDPQAPKPNKTPFNFFSVDARIKAKELNPHLNQTEITKKVGEMWSKATDSEKAPYIALSNQDKMRYQAELEAYNYRLAAQAAQAQAAQASQAVAAAQNALGSHQQLPMHLFTETGVTPLQMQNGAQPPQFPYQASQFPQQHQQYEVPTEEDPQLQ